MAAIAGAYSRRLTGEDVGFFYDEGLWGRRFGMHYLPETPSFSFNGDTFQHIPSKLAGYANDCEDFWLWLYRPKKGDVVVDIGAGRGEDVFRFSRFASRVLAVEADPVNFRYLSVFCRMNRLGNVTYTHGAATDKTTTVYIAPTSSDWQIAPTSSDWQTSTICNGNEHGTPVPGFTLGDLCTTHGIDKIDFLKMNIEGAERLALSSAGEVLARTGNVCIACHDFIAEDEGGGPQFRTREFVIDVLQASGFDVKLRRDDPRPYVRDHVHGFR